MVDYPEFGLNEEKVENISLASILHDIGKIAIPDNILLKQSKLTKDEKEYMKSHTLRGCEIIENMKGVWGKDIEKIIYDVCRNHHERYDGKGYPDGLVGDKTPIAAQIVAIADAYDELISERNYKRAYGRDEAFQMILAGDCGVFSPKILEVFRLCRKEIENVL
jgi:putative two-component system response regulator